MESRIKYFLIAGLILIIAVVAIWNYVAMLSEPDVTSFVEQPADTAADTNNRTAGPGYPGIGDTAPGTNVVRTTIGGTPANTRTTAGGGSGASLEPNFSDDNPLVAVRDSTGRIINNPLSDSPDEHPIDVDGTMLSADNPRLNPNGIPLPASCTVQSGDNLSKISKKYYGTDKHWKKIQKANNIERPEHLYIGMKLTIPALDNATAAAPAAASSSLAATGAGVGAGGTYYHVVASGDSLWKIAEKYYGKGTKYKEIEAANPNIKNGRLALGQRVAIPNYAPAGATPAATGTAMH